MKFALIEYFVPNTSFTVIQDQARKGGMLEKSYVVEYSILAKGIE